MLSSLKRLTTVAAVTTAIAGLGPVALAGAATAPTAPATPSWSLPFQNGIPGIMSPFQGFGPSSPFPGQSCSVGQGIFPGFINLGPTGPLGPLGPQGPLGNGNNNLPCGLSVFNLGPSGPLGGGGALGGLGG